MIMPRYLPRAVIFYREGLGLRLRGFIHRREANFEDRQVIIAPKPVTGRVPAAMDVRSADRTLPVLRRETFFLCSGIYSDLRPHREESVKER